MTPGVRKKHIETDKLWVLCTTTAAAAAAAVAVAAATATAAVVEGFMHNVRYAHVGTQQHRADEREEAAVGVEADMKATNFLGNGRMLHELRTASITVHTIPCAFMKMNH